MLNGADINHRQEEVSEVLPQNQLKIMHNTLRGKTLIGGRRRFINLRSQETSLRPVVREKILHRIQNLYAGFTDDRCNLLPPDPIHAKRHVSPNFFYPKDYGFLGGLKVSRGKIPTSIVETAISLSGRREKRSAQRGIA